MWGDKAQTCQIQTLGGRYMGNDYTSVTCYLFIKGIYFYIYICRYLDQIIYIQLLFERVWWYSKQVSKGVYVWYIGFYKQTCLYNYIPITSCFINKCLHSSVYELSFKWREHCFVSVILFFEKKLKWSSGWPWISHPLSSTLQILD